VFNLGPAEIATLVVAGLLIFGPDRLPKVAADAGRMLRQLRRMANDVKSDLGEELGPELADLDLRSMSPKALIHKHFLDPALDEVAEVRSAVAEDPAPTPAPPSLVKTPAAARDGHSTPYDVDAT